MLSIIMYFIIIFALVSIPYRKIYNRLNQLINAKAVLISLFLMAFPFVWMWFGPEMTDAYPAEQNGPAGMIAAMAPFSVGLSWLMAIAGVVMIGFAVWTASEHQEEMKRLNEMHAAEDKPAV